MLNPTESVISRNDQCRKSIENNIIFTKNALNQIKNYQNNNILPFSLKQQHHHPLKSSQFSQHDFKQLDQSNLSQKLHHFCSKNTPSQAQSTPHQPLLNHQKKIQAEPFNQIHTEPSHPQKNSQKQYQNLQYQKNTQSVTNKNLLMQGSRLSKIQVQVHLTIAKKKFTLKLSNLISNNELGEMIEQFLIQNNISNPSKRNHTKTKNSIMEMVQQKLQQSQTYSHQNQKKSSPLKNGQPLNNLKQKIDESFSEQKDQTANQKVKRNKDHLEKENWPQNQDQVQKKFERRVIKSISRVSVCSDRSEEVCSPSFKQSDYVPKSSFVRTSNFSPQPKNKQNKYQQLVSNCYNNRINLRPNFADNQFGNELKPIEKQENANQIQQKGKNEPINQVRQKYIHLQQTHNRPNLNDLSFPTNNHPSSSTPKSVYEKWKQKEKSKQNTKPSNQSFHNALKEKKMPSNNQRTISSNQITSGSYKKTKINYQQLKDSQNKKSPIKPNQNKWIKKVKDQFMSKSIHNQSTKKSNHQKSQTKPHKFDQKQKQNQLQNSFGSLKPENRSFSNIKRPLNKTSIENLNKTQIFNDKFHGSNYSPYHQQINQFSSDVSPIRPNKSTKKNRNFENQKSSHVYTVDDQQFPSTHHQAFQMSPDHFYKQGLVFEAKKQHEITQKFKSIYPFTTRIQQISLKQRKITSNAQSGQKYFSSKVTNKSLTNLVLSENTKSALHERLYKDDKDKKMKQVQIQANKRIFKIAKTPTPQIQINLMQQNLKHIKGLSQQKKIKLIQKNIQIKQKIREKDKMIDQELQKMIKQGKVKPSCEIVSMRKSPFRKTQVF